jgi:hypothetical protein
MYYRNKDINRPVTLKIATMSIGQNNKPWTSADLKEIKARTDRLLTILDGQASYE